MTDLFQGEPAQSVRKLVAIIRTKGERDRLAGALALMTLADVIERGDPDPGDIAVEIRAIALDALRPSVRKTRPRRGTGPIDDGER